MNGKKTLKNLLLHHKLMNLRMSINPSLHPKTIFSSGISTHICARLVPDATTTNSNPAQVRESVHGDVPKEQDLIPIRESDLQTLLPHERGGLPRKTDAVSFAEFLHHHEGVQAAAKSAVPGPARPFLLQPQLQQQPEDLQVLPRRRQLRPERQRLHPEHRHSRGIVLEEAAHVPSQAESDGDHFRAALWIRHGRNGNYY